MTAQKQSKKKPKPQNKFLIVALCAAIMVAGGLVARAVKPSEADTKGASDKIATVSASDHETIKAEVLNDDPSEFTIDVEKLANINADDNAETFAVYTSSSKPDTCGDFRELELPYEKPEEYKRVFDLSDHPEVIEALDSYHCVVMRNIPPNAS